MSEFVLTTSLDESMLLAMNSPATTAASANSPANSRLERAIATLRHRVKEWQDHKSFGRLGVEIDIESGTIVIARVTAIDSIK